MTSASFLAQLRLLRVARVIYRRQLGQEKGFEEPCAPPSARSSPVAVFSPPRVMGLSRPAGAATYFSGRVGRAGGGWLGGWCHLASAQRVGHSPWDPLRCTPTVPGGHWETKPPSQCSSAQASSPASKGSVPLGMAPSPPTPPHTPPGRVQPPSGLSPAAALLLPGFAPLGARGVPSSCPRWDGSGRGLGGTPRAVVGAELGGYF